MKPSKTLLVAVSLLLILALFISHEYRSYSWSYENASLIGVWNGKVAVLKDNTLLILNVTNGQVLKEFPNTSKAFLIGNTISAVSSFRLLNINLEDFTTAELNIPEGIDSAELVFGVSFGNFSLYSTIHPVRGKYIFDVIEYHVCTQNCSVYSFRTPPGSYPMVYTFPKGYILTFETNEVFAKGSAVVLDKNGSFMWNLTTNYAISDFEYSNDTLFFSTGGTEPGGTTIAGGDIYAFSLNGPLKWHIDLGRYDGKFYDWAVAGMKARDDLYAIGYTGRVYVIDFNGTLKRITASPVSMGLKTPSLIKGVKAAKNDLMAFAYTDIKRSGLFREAKGICVCDFKGFKCWKTKNGW